MFPDCSGNYAIVAVEQQENEKHVVEVVQRVYLRERLHMRRPEGTQVQSTADYA